MHIFWHLTHCRVISYRRGLKLEWKIKDKERRGKRLQSFWFRLFDIWYLWAHTHTPKTSGSCKLADLSSDPLPSTPANYYLQIPLMWWATSKTAFMIPASWNSHHSLTPSPSVWAGPITWFQILEYSKGVTSMLVFYETESTRWRSQFPFWL